MWKRSSSRRLGTLTLRGSSLLGLMIMAGCEVPAKSESMTTPGYILLIVVVAAIAFGAVLLAARSGN